MPARLKKRWGQHHLVRPGVCRPMVEFLAPAGQRVLEIGPGGGALTRLLLERGARVLAVEVDREWAFGLAATMGTGSGSLAVADALELSYERLPSPTLVAGNLPYNVATALIMRILATGAGVPRAAFLVQREVAERLTAPPGRRAYGALTVLSSCYADARRLGHLRPGAFRPPPKVESTMVGFTRREPPLGPTEMERFRRFVRAGFHQKRKTLVNALSAHFPRSMVTAALEEIGVDARIRAEAVALEEWVALYQAVVAYEGARGRE